MFPETYCSFNYIRDIILILSGTATSQFVASTLSANLSAPISSDLLKCSISFVEEEIDKLIRNE